MHDYSSITVKTIYGEIIVPNSPEDLICRFLDVYGEWGYLECLFLSQFARGALVLDAGAFVGTFSLGMSQLGAEHVVAVEANPDIIQYLELNSHLARNSRISVENAVLGYSDAALQGTIAAQDNLGSFQVAAAKKSNGDRNALEIVPRKTLGEIRASYGDFALLKLDLEGAEYDTLKEDAVWIRETQPVIWLECNEDDGYPLIWEILTWAGYDIYYFSFPSFRKKNFRGTTSHIFPIAYEAGILGVKPSTKVVLASALEDEECILKRVESEQDIKTCLWLTPRWGKSDWVNLSRPELIASLSRYSANQSFEKFLGEGDPGEVTN